MAKLHLNQRIVDRLVAPDPSGKDVLYWDENVKGLGVRVSGKTGTKTYVAQRDLPGGKSRRINIAATNTMTLAEAKQRAGDILNDLRIGIDPKRKVINPTLRSTLESYLAARPNLAPDSIRMYRQIERTLTAWLDDPLRDITPDMVEARHRALAAMFGKNPRYNGHATANFAMRTLRALWAFAADANPDLGPNPVQRLKRQWFAEVRRERVVTAEQLPKFYRAVLGLPNPIARDYILLMLFTGLRRREASRLTWDNIDLVERVIRLPATSTKAKRKLDLPMSDYVHDMLVARRSLGRDAFIFPGRFMNSPIADVDQSFRKIAAATGIVVSSHDLRRTFASTAGATAIPPFALSALLNHSTGNDVTAGYVVMSSPVLREAAQLVADRIAALCGVAPIGGGNVARLKKK